MYILQREIIPSGFFFVCLLGMVMCFPGCNSKKNGLIESVGEYPLEGVQLNLKVSKVNNLVCAELVDVNGIRYLNQEGSVYSRWFFWWDKETKTLWYYSGDVGLFFYEESQGYKENSVVDGDSTVMPARISELVRIR